MQKTGVIRYKSFWFNKDCRLAIPSVAIPYGQRYITVDIEAQQNLVYAAPGNLFLQLTTEAFDTTNAPAYNAVGITGYRRYVTRKPVVVPTSAPSSAQGIKTFDLYINNIFVNPEIHDILMIRM